MKRGFSSPNPATRAAQVVHVEDDLEWSELVGRWVRGKGLTFQSVRSQAELKAYLNRHASPPQCLVLDAGLGGESGLDLCERLKGTPGLQATPIIILTGGGPSSEDCLRHGALQFVLKDSRAESAFNAVLTAVLAQHSRSQGVISADDLVLDPRDRSVSVRKRSPVTLKPGPFAALQRLVAASPMSVSDAELYASFLERRPYDTPEHELAARDTLKNYVSRLRGELGEPLAKRIMRQREGYAYVPPTPLPRL